jgi:hypothetical protein
VLLLPVACAFLRTVGGLRIEGKRPRYVGMDVRSFVFFFGGFASEDLWPCFIASSCDFRVA